MTLRIWDLERSTCTSVLEGHTEWVTRIEKLDEKWILSASDDRTIKLWNISEREYKKKLKRTYLGH